MKLRETVRDTMRSDLLAMADLPYDGEDVDQLAHALQAGTLAVAAGAGPRWWPPRCCTTSAGCRA